MVMVLLMSVLAMATHRSALVQLRVATALHDGMRVDLAVASALREAEGELWRMALAGAPRDPCLDIPAGCVTVRAGIACTVVDLGVVRASPGWRRYRLTARDDGTAAHVVREQEAVLVVGSAPFHWHRESWRVVGDE